MERTVCNCSKILVLYNSSDDNIVKQFSYPSNKLFSVLFSVVDFGNRRLLIVDSYTLVYGLSVLLVCHLLDLTSV